MVIFFVDFFFFFLFGWIHLLKIFLIQWKDIVIKVNGMLWKINFSTNIFFNELFSLVHKFSLVGIIKKFGLFIEFYLLHWRLIQIEIKNATTSQN